MEKKKKKKRIIGIWRGEPRFNVIELVSVTLWDRIEEERRFLNKELCLT